MPIKKITEIKGKGIPIKGNDIDTDRIIPARFLKEITFENMGKYSFYDERFDENGNKKKHPFNDEKYRHASILVVNNNFGCGSSREHAPQSLMRFGIKAIIGEGFADIFSGNCSMIGLPAVTADKKGINKLMEFVDENPDKEIKIDLIKMEVQCDGVKLNLSMNESALNSLISGTWDSMSMMLEAKEKIKQAASRLPYLDNFEQD